MLATLASHNNWGGPIFGLVLLVGDLVVYLKVGRLDVDDVVVGFRPLDSMWSSWEAGSHSFPRSEPNTLSLRRWHREDLAGRVMGSSLLFRAASLRCSPTTG